MNEYNIKTFDESIKKHIKPLKLERNGYVLAMALSGALAGACTNFIGSESGNGFNFIGVVACSAFSLYYLRETNKLNKKISVNKYLKENSDKAQLFKKGRHSLTKTIPFTLGAAVFQHPKYYEVNYKGEGFDGVEYNVSNTRDVVVFGEDNDYYKDFGYPSSYFAKETIQSLENYGKVLKK